MVYNWAMSENVNLAATGLYLRFIREARGLSREQVASEAGTSASQIERIENGKQETRSSVMLAFLKTIRANADHLAWLIRTPDATVEDSQRLAAEVLSPPPPQPESQPQPQKPIKLTDEQMERLRTWIRSVPDDVLNVLVGILRDSESNPQMVAYIEGYYDALLDKVEQKASSQKTSDVDTGHPVPPQTPEEK